MDILIYNISYKTFDWRKPLCIRFYKVNGFYRFKIFSIVWPWKI